jgi:hypothetical protein
MSTRGTVETTHWAYINDGDQDNWAAELHKHLVGRRVTFAQITSEDRPAVTEVFTVTEVKVVDKVINIYGSADACLEVMAGEHIVVTSTNVQIRRLYDLIIFTLVG